MAPASVSARTYQKTNSLKEKPTLPRHYLLTPITPPTKHLNIPRQITPTMTKLNLMIGKFKKKGLLGTAKYECDMKKLRAFQYIQTYQGDQIYV